MDDDLNELELADLAGMAGVSVRTIRYYQQQGLLRAPGQRGPGARYGEGDLNRLLLIRTLQREHLPLAEIRRRLEAMSDAEVAAALAAPGPGVVRSPAAQYAREVLAGQGPLQEMPRGVREGPAKGPERRVFGLRRESWERIVLGTDIELHVRRPLSLPQNRLVERLVEAARRYYEEEGAT